MSEQILRHDVLGVKYKIRRKDREKTFTAETAETKTGSRELRDNGTRREK